MVTMSENSWRFLSRDPSTGAVEYYKYDADGDRCIIRRSADITAQVERTKRSQLDEDGWNADHTMRKAAEISPEVQLIWFEKYGIRAWDKNHKPAVRKLLNSNEWRHIRWGKHFII
jgi:hypothetical protein